MTPQGQKPQPGDDLPDDPITAGPGAQKPQAGPQAGGADDLGLPDDPITGEGKVPAYPKGKPFAGSAQLTDEQKAAMARTDKYLKEHDAAPEGAWENIREFGETGWEDIKGIGKTLWTLGTEDPDKIPGQLWEMAKGLGKAQLDEFKKAYDAYKEGDYAHAATYTGFGLIPLIGPAGADIAEDIQAGHYGRAGARLLELVGPELFKYMKIGPVASKLKVAPELEHALTETEQAGVETTVGQRMRNPRLQKAERSLENFPGSEKQRAAQLEKQRSQLKARGEQIAEKQSPTTPKITQSETGARVQERMKQRVNRFQAGADQAYDEFRSQAALGKKNLQNGWKNIYDQHGNFVRRDPVMKDFETPVDIRKIQADLRPVWDELQGPFQQPAQAQASPGFIKFQQLMHTKDWYMDAVDFDRTMGAIKSITRDGKNELLSNRSQGIAKLMIKEGEQALDRAFAGVRSTSPTIKQALERGRRLVRTYYDQAEFTRKLGQNPSDVYQFLTRTGKGSLEEIKLLRSYAPSELNQVARSFLEGMIQEGSEAGGPFERMGRMASQFEGLDGEVQEALFGKAQAGEIQRYLNAARYLNPLEGSNTFGKFAQALHYGPALEAIGSLLMGHFAAAGAGAVAYVGLQQIGPRIAARLLLQPGTPRLLTTVIKLPGNSKIWTRAVQTLTVRAMAAEQHERRLAEEDQRAKEGRPAPGAAPQGGRGGRPAAAATGGGRGAPQRIESTGVPREQKPSPIGPATEAPGGQEGAPSQTPTRAPGTAAASGIQTPSPTTVAGWPTGNVPPVMPSPQGGTRPQAVAPQASPPGNPQAPAPPAAAQNQPPPGTTWEYWGLKPPARPGEQPQPISPPARPPVRPDGRAAQRPPNTRIYPQVARWQPTVQKIGQSMGVPPGLMTAIVQLESSGNPNARGTSGEIGLAQLMPATAKTLGVDPRDPEQSLRGMATLLRHLMQKYKGDVRKVLAAYNEGETIFDKRMRRGLPLPDTTQLYVRNAMALLGGGRPAAAGAGGGQ